MKVSNKRFHYCEFSRCIKDDLTGHSYSNLNDVTDLLNHINDKADRNAELVDESIMGLMYEKEKYKNLYDDVINVMIKYGIDSVEKLDQVLFNQRVW